MPIQSCTDDMHVVPLRVHLENGAPSSIKPLEPGEAPDKYIPPDEHADRIRSMVQNAGGLNICQKDGRLFAVLPNKSEASAFADSIKKASIEKTRQRATENLDELFRFNVGEEFYDLTIRYLQGEMEVKAYLDQTANSLPKDIDAASMYLFRTLWLDNFRSMSTTIHPSAEAEIEELLTSPEPFDSEDATGHWRYLAQTYLKADRAKEAIAASRWTVKLDPEDPNNWRVLAQAHYTFYQADPENRKHLLKETAQAFAKATALDKDNFEDMLNLGRLELALDNLTAAARAFEKAIEIHLRLNTDLDKEDGEVLAELSQAYYRLGRFEDALHAAREANKILEGENDWALVIMAQSLIELGQSEQAIKPIRQAIDMHREEAHLWEVLGIALQQSDKLEEAITAFKTAVEKKGHTIDMRLRLANVLAQLHNRQQNKDPALLKESYTTLVSIAEQRPNHKDIELLKAQGSIAYELSKFYGGFLEIAISHYEHAVQLDWNNPELWAALAPVYRKSGSPQDVAAALKQELIARKRMRANGIGAKDAKNEARIQELEDILGDIGSDNREGSGTPPAMPGTPNATASSEGGEEVAGLVELNNPEEVSRLLTEAFEDYPVQHSLWDKISDVVDSSNREKFRNGIIESYELDPNTPSILERVARIMIGSHPLDPQGKSFKEVETLFASLSTKYDPENADEARALGKIALVLRKYETATSHFKRATSLEPTNNDNWRYLAKLHKQAGRPREELDALLQMQVNGIVDKKEAKMIEARIWELGDMLGKIGFDDPEGSGTPPAAPEGSGTIPSPQGPGSDQLMRSATSLGSFDIREEEHSQSQSAAGEQSYRSAAALYRRRNSRRRNPHRHVTPFDIIRSSVLGASGMQVRNGTPLPVTFGLPVH